MALEVSLPFPGKKINEFVRRGGPGPSHIWHATLVITFGAV